MLNRFKEIDIVGKLIIKDNLHENVHPYDIFVCTSG